jgi:xylulokinase
MAPPLLLGYDIGSSFIKASLIDAESGGLIASFQSPEQEMRIEAPQAGWAEQHPDLWWQHVVLATRGLLTKAALDHPDVRAIGIAYQMHGLVMVDRNNDVLAPSIIWCDSRAVETGRDALKNLGTEYCFQRYLNAPGNFTASKVKWVRDNRPNVFKNIAKIMLPGDYIAYKLTGKVSTTISGLSEGILWDFGESRLASALMSEYGIDESLIPELVPTFGLQGQLGREAARELGLSAGTPVSYRAGDQPNNALSLNVLSPGEAATTAGTSGVIYGITEENIFDPAGRVNTFAHVNYSASHPCKGVLLCINGTGIQYSWLRQHVLDHRYTYEQMNTLAESVERGSDGVRCYPYGNGAERMLENVDIGCHFSGINFNIHGKQHLIRSAHEGIAFSFRYGLDILRAIGLQVSTIKAGRSNLFQSRVFCEAFVNACNVALEIYNTDGAQGAARGAGIGAGVFATPQEAFKGLSVTERIAPGPDLVGEYEAAYGHWRDGLRRLMVG